MSKTRLSTADKNKLFFESGGLCALCRSSISYDRISRKNVRTDEYAHIIADSPDGPRGDETSRSRAKDITNILLLCPNCHSIIDKEIKSFPAKRLQELRRSHTQLVRETLDSLQNKEALAVKYAAPIGQCAVSIDETKVEAAIRASAYLAQRFLIDLNPNHSLHEDTEKEYWASQWEQLKLNFEQKIAVRQERGEEKPFLLFAVAPQPLLIRLGILMNDLYEVHVFQKKREPDTWEWLSEEVKTHYKLIRPQERKANVALNLSLSANIEDRRIYSVLGNDTSIWKLTHDRPDNDYLRTPEQLADLRALYRRFFQVAKEFHGHNTVLHVFPACPVSAAIEFGRIYMPKADLPLILYDQNKDKNAFELAYDLNCVKR